MAILLPENSVSIFRGTSKTLKLTVKDGDGELVNLTGSTIHFTVKKNEKCDEHALIQKSSANVAQIEIPNPTDGTANIYLTPEDTYGLAVGKYKFDVWVILPSTERYVAVPPSVFEVKAGVTFLNP